MLRSPVLAIPAFRNLWLGQAISQFGDAFYYVSFMFMVQKLTGDFAMVGYVGAAEMLPFLLFSPYAGVLADRVDRRKLMLWSDVVSASTLGLLAVLLVFRSTPPVWVLVVTPFVLSTVRAFFLPAKSASVPVIVPKDLVLQANSFSMATQNVMPLIGLGLSAGIMGILYAAMPGLFFLACCLVNGLSFIGSAVFIAKLPSILPQRDGRANAHPLRDMWEGLVYIKKRHVLIVLMLLGLFMNLSISPFFVAFVAANAKWFGGTPTNLAWCEFSFFLGMIIGSFAVGKLRVRRPGLGYVYGLAVVGVAVALMAGSRSMALFMVWNTIAGIALPFAQIPVSTYVQLTVPDSFRGRVNSTLMMTATATQPVGMALGGMLLESVGLVWMFLSMGIGMGTIALIGLLDRPFRTSVIPAMEDVPDTTEAYAAG